MIDLHPKIPLLFAQKICNRVDMRKTANDHCAKPELSTGSDGNSLANRSESSPNLCESFARFAN